MARDPVRDLVGRITIHTIMRPRALIRCVIGQFGLVKVNPSPIAIPQRLILLMMLVEKAVDGHVIAIHHQAVLAWIYGPTDGAGVAMIRPPEPEVVTDDIVGIDRHAVGRCSYKLPAYPAEDVV